VTTVDDTPVTAAVDMSATGGLDAVGNWHDTDGRFQKRGVSTAKHAAVKVLRGVLAAAHVKDRTDGGDLTLGDRAPVGLAEKVGHRVRVRYHDDRHGLIEHAGRKILVPWDAFDDPAPHVPDAPGVGDTLSADRINELRARTWHHSTASPAWADQHTFPDGRTRWIHVGPEAAAAQRMGDRDDGGSHTVIGLDGSASTVASTPVVHQVRLKPDARVDPVVHGDTAEPDGRVGIGYWAGPAEPRPYDAYAYVNDVEAPGEPSLMVNVDAIDRPSGPQANDLPDGPPVRPVTEALADSDVMSPRDAMIDLVAERHLAVAELRARDEVPPQFEAFGHPWRPNDSKLSLTDLAADAATLPQAPPTPSPAPVSTDALASAEAAADGAIDRLFDIHHDDMGINGVDLPTLPTLASGHRWRGRDLPPETQEFALSTLFRPDVPASNPYFQPLPVIDGEPGPLGAVGVNVDTGEIVGTRAPWDPTGATMPPGGRWVSLPADDPKAADLVTAAWLAAPGTKRYLAEQLYPRLRGGYNVDPLFPGLTEAVRRHADEIAAPYRDRTGITVRRVTDVDGTFYVPDPDGKLSVDGPSIHFADFADDGTTRLWVHPDAVAEPDARDDFAALDYTTVDDPNVPWADRVAALSDIRKKMAAVFGPTPSDLFTTPTEADLPDLIAGRGGERELAHIAAVQRFGESLEQLVADRRATLATQPDKRSVVDKIASTPGVPPPLATLLTSEQWEAAVVGAVVNPTSDRPHGGGSLAITFPDHPESGLRIFTSARTGTTTIAWEFDGEHQNTLGAATFDGWSPYGSVTVDAAAAPASWFDSLREPGGTATTLRPGENSPEMAAWLDTMTKLGIDMGTDDSIFFAAGRDTIGEQYGDPARGAVPIRAGDLQGTLARTVEVGLRPYPKSWTSTLGGKLTRIAIDSTRNAPAGTSAHFPDVAIIDVPSVDVHGDYSDVPTHEFAHAFERGVDGLMLIETWHFIQRLRAEMKAHERLAHWQWSDTQYGYRDEFGDEYMGRIYRSSRTGVEGVTADAGHEIFSTVSQTLWANDPARNPVDLDPQARRLFLGLMAIVDPKQPPRWKP
jgi:hypothetical protein